MAQPQPSSSAGLDAAEDLLPDVAPPSAFGAGVRSGAGGIVGALGGLTRMVGDATTVKPISDVGGAVAGYGAGVVERNASPIQKLSDIDSLGKLGNTVAFALGNTAPSLAAALVGGALGRKLLTRRFPGLIRALPASPPNREALTAPRTPLAGESR